MTSRLEPMFDTDMGLTGRLPTLIDPAVTDSKRMRFTSSRAGVAVLPMVPTAAGGTGAAAGAMDFSLPSAKTLMIGGAVVAGLLLLRRWA